jgi:hypothetical protein
MTKIGRRLTEEWADIINVLLKRIISTFRTQNLTLEERLDFSRRTRELEALFIDIGESQEIDGANRHLCGLTNRLSRLHELIMTTHEVIDHISRVGYET